MKKLKFMTILILILGLVLAGCDNKQTPPPPGSGSNPSGSTTPGGSETPGGSGSIIERALQFKEIDPEIGDEAKIVIGYIETVAKSSKNELVLYYEGLNLLSEYPTIKMEKELYTATELGLTPVYVTEVKDIPSGITKICVGGGIDRFEEFGSEVGHQQNNTVTEAYIAPGATKIGSYAFAHYLGLNSVEISNSVKEIGRSAFGYCSSLATIEIPKGVTVIDVLAFVNCSQLTSITIPDGVTIIGFSAFEHCNSLTSITLPNSVNTINSSAFKNCSSLTTITIPSSVTSIGNFVFTFCSSLTEINYLGSQEQWNAINKGSKWDENSGTYTINFNVTP